MLQIFVQKSIFTEDFYVANLPFMLQVIIDLVGTKQSAFHMCAALGAREWGFLMS